MTARNESQLKNEAFDVARKTRKLCYDAAKRGFNSKSKGSRKHGVLDRIRAVALPEAVRKVGRAAAGRIDRDELRKLMMSAIDKVIPSVETRVQVVNCVLLLLDREAALAESQGEPTEKLIDSICDAISCRRIDDEGNKLSLDEKVEQIISSTKAAWREYDRAHDRIRKLTTPLPSASNSQDKPKCYGDELPDTHYMPLPSARSTDGDVRAFLVEWRKIADNLWKRETLFGRNHATLYRMFADKLEAALEGRKG